MQPTVREILSIIDRIAPFSLAEEWDNCGLQAGDLSWKVNKVLVALDISMDVMYHAVASRADLVISHHPLMFSAPKNIDFGIMPGSAIALSAKEKIAIVSAHTNLDKVQGGLNDLFASILGLSNIKTLVASKYSVENSENAPDGIGKNIVEEDDPITASDRNKGSLSNSCTACVNGIGRTGELESVSSLKELALHVKKIFNLETIRMIGNPDLPVKHVALCTGSGGSLLSDFFRSKADVYITGDIKYHEARDIEQAKLGLIDLGHFASEKIAVDLLCDKIKKVVIKKGINLKIEGFYAESDPFVTLYDII